MLRHGNDFMKWLIGAFLVGISLVIVSFFSLEHFEFFQHSIGAEANGTFDRLALIEPSSAVVGAAAGLAVSLAGAIVAVKLADRALAETQRQGRLDEVAVFRDLVISSGRMERFTQDALKVMRQSEEAIRAGEELRYLQKKSRADAEHDQNDDRKRTIERNLRFRLREISKELLAVINRSDYGRKRLNNLLQEAQIQKVWNEEAGETILGKKIRMRKVKNMEAEAGSRPNLRAHFKRIHINEGELDARKAFMYLLPRVASETAGEEPIETKNQNMNEERIDEMLANPDCDDIFFATSFARGGFPSGVITDGYLGDVEIEYYPVLIEIALAASDPYSEASRLIETDVAQLPISERNRPYLEDVIRAPLRAIEEVYPDAEFAFTRVQEFNTDSILKFSQDQDIKKQIEADKIAERIRGYG